MLELPGRTDRAHTLRPLGRAVEFAYAGLAFELRLAASHVLQIPEDFLPYLVFAQQPNGKPVATAARLTCSLIADDTMTCAPDALSRVVREAGGARQRLRHALFDAEIVRAGARDYAVTARMAPSALAMAAFLRFVSAFVQEQRGGLPLHAAAVGLDGRAVLFVGPSGAGKSTACDLTPGASCLAHDQVIVYRAAGGYHAWGMPWGRKEGRERSGPTALPLGACLRVTRGTPEPRAWAADPVESAFLVRAAVNPDRGSDAALEQVRLESAILLAQAIPVGYLSTVLGKPTDDTLRAFLSTTARDGVREDTVGGTRG